MDQRIESGLIVRVVGAEGAVCIYCKAGFIENRMTTWSRPHGDSMFLEEPSPPAMGDGRTTGHRGSTC